MYHCFPWFTNQGSEWYWISHMWMLQYGWEGGGQVKDSAITREVSGTGYPTCGCYSMWGRGGGQVKDYNGNQQHSHFLVTETRDSGRFQ